MLNKEDFKSWLLFTAMLMLLLAISKNPNAIVKAETTDADEWPMFSRDPAHTGYSTSTSPNDNILWIYETDGAVSSSPAVADGLVYIGSRDGNVYCLDAYTGVYQWSYDTGDYVFSSPAVADGLVYVGTSSWGRGYIHCLDGYTGALQWSYQAGRSISSSPAVTEGRVYVGSFDGNVYCLNAYTGDLQWNYQTDSSVESSPAVMDDLVYIGSDDGRVYCLDAHNGALRWSYNTDDDVRSSPAVVDGLVYIGSDDDRLYCLDANTGALKWSHQTEGNVLSSPAVADGRVYLGSWDKKIHCLDADTGALQWSYQADSGIESSPAVAGGSVYTGSYYGSIYCLDADSGTLQWSYKTDHRLHSSPTIAEGLLYIGSFDNNVYCFGSYPLTISLVEPSNGDIVDCPVALGARINYKGKPLQRATLTFYVDSSSIGSSASDSGGYASIGFSGREGIYHWYATATFGNESGTSDVWVFKCIVEYEDEVPPDTFIMHGPMGEIDYGDLNFTWIGKDDATSIPNLLYSYRLQGFRESWSPWTSETNKSYSDLPNGLYEFEVKSRDEAGNEDLTPAKRAFIVSNPVLSVQPNTYDFGKPSEGEAPSKTFSVLNKGGGTLTWKIASHSSWMTVNPANGTGSGNFTVTVNPSINPGLHRGDMLVISNGGTQIITVEVYGPKRVTVTFNRVGIPEDISTTILEVDGIKYETGDQLSFEWIEGSSHSYAWLESVNGSVGKRYPWARTEGLSNRRSDVISVSMNGSITAYFNTLYVIDHPDWQPTFYGEVLSNSSIQSVSGLQDSSGLIIVVEGDKGTRGFVKISLPLLLLDEQDVVLDDILVLMNDALVEPSINRRDKRCIIELSYEHSEHIIAVYLRSVTFTVEIVNPLLGIISKPLKDIQVEVLRSDGNVFTQGRTTPNGKISFKLIPSVYTVKASYFGQELLKEIHPSSDETIQFKFFITPLQIMMASSTSMISLSIIWLYWKEHKLIREINQGEHDDKFIEVCNEIKKPFSRSTLVMHFKHKYIIKLNLGKANLFFRRFERSREGSSYIIAGTKYFVHESIWSDLPPNEHALLQEILTHCGSINRAELLVWSKLDTAEFESIIMKLERDGYIMYEPETGNFRLIGTKTE